MTAGGTHSLELTNPIGIAPAAFAASITFVTVSNAREPYA